MTRSVLKTYINNWYKNWSGAKAITGPVANTLFTNLVDNLLNLDDDASLLGLFTYSPTRSYIIGQGVLYAGALYVCNANTTGAWDSSKWDIVVSAARDEFTFTPADIGSKMTLISGYVYQKTHSLDTMTPKFRLTRPSGEIFTEQDLAFEVIDADTIQLDFGFEIEAGTSYVLIEK